MANSLLETKFQEPFSSTPEGAVVSLPALLNPIRWIVFIQSTISTAECSHHRHTVSRTHGW